MHSTALFFCVLFSLISNHLFAQFIIKNILLPNYKIQQKNKVLIIII